MTTETNWTGTGYLRGMSAEDVASGIANLPRERFERMVGRHMPGGFNVAPGSTMAEALAANDADFTVEKAPLYHVTGTDKETGAPLFSEVAGRVVLRARETRVDLGTAGPDYGIVQTLDALAAPAHLVQTGQMELTSIQVRENGARIRVAGLIGATTLQAFGRPTPDVLAHLALFEANHTGRHSTIGQAYTVNLKCFNGMTSKATAAAFSVAHTRNAQARTEEASAAFLNVSEATLAEAALFERLGQTRMRLDDARAFAAALVEEERGEASEDDSERKRLARARLVDSIVEGFTSGTGCVGQTAWDAYNAVTEETTGAAADNVSEAIQKRYARAKDAAARFAKDWESQATGHYARRKDRALRLLTR